MWPTKKVYVPYKKSVCDPRVCFKRKDCTSQPWAEVERALQDAHPMMQVACVMADDCVRLSESYMGWSEIIINVQKMYAGYAVIAAYEGIRYPSIDDISKHLPSADYASLSAALENLPWEESPSSAAVQSLPEDYFALDRTSESRIRIRKVKKQTSNDFK